jgi:hypothetical protein
MSPVISSRQPGCLFLEVARGFAPPPCGRFALFWSYCQYTHDKKSVASSLRSGSHSAESKNYGRMRVIAGFPALSFTLLVSFAVYR